MKKFYPLIFGIILLLAGIVLIFAAKSGDKTILVNGTRVRYDSLKMYDYTASNSITSLDINLSFSDVTIIPSNDNRITIKYGDFQEEPIIKIKESGGTLKISSIETSSGVSLNYDFDLNDYSNMKIYVPEGKLDSIKLVMSSGNAEIKEITTDEDIDATISFGNITLSTVNVYGKLTANTSSGNIIANDTYSKGEMNLETSFGDIKGSSVKTSVFDANTSSGNIKIKKLFAEKEIKGETSFGNIDLQIDDSEDYFSITSKTSFGDSNITNLRNKDATKTLSLTTSSGNIEVHFTK